MSSPTTLSHKLTRIVMLTCASVILLTLMVEIVIQGTNLRESMIDKMSTLAKVIGETSKESLTLQLKYQAEPILSTLKTEPTIETAYILDKNNLLFAQYINRSKITFAEIISKKTFQIEKLQQAEKTRSTIYIFSTQNFSLYSPIFHNGVYLGTVYLQASLNPILVNLLWFFVAALVMLFVSLLVAYLLTTRLQPLVITPLQQLIMRMRTVTENKIYEPHQQPMVQTNIEEIKELQGGFDEMLIQINKRQDELHKHSQLLEDKVSQRTYDLQQSNKELRKTVTELDIARKEAVDASAAKSRFLANMSHEIRTPMIGVLGMAELLLKNTTDSYQHELTRTIHSSGESLLAILNDLLDISKIEAGKLELEFNHFNPLETLEHAVDLLADNAFTKGLEITTIASPALSESLLGDAERLRQIILNLLSNAIKFTTKGFISIVMSSKPLTKSTTELKIEVCDTGIGISDNAKEKVFAAFTQADSSTTRNYGGTGLGLTIVNQLVELMGGQITVTDRIPHGSCFTVTIPMACSTSCPGAEVVNSKYQRALIATDNPDLEQLLREHLTSWGVTTTTVNSPWSTLKPAGERASDFDIVFLDSKYIAQISELNCIQQHDNKHQPKVVTVARHHYALSESRPAESSNYFLSKPVKINDLKNIVLSDAETQPVIKTSSTPTPTASIEQKQDQRVIRILLAEDNQTNQRLAQLILEQNGYQLTIVSNGKEAVEETRNGSFDLILMDCQMPEMDGYAAARTIRQHNATPIIALTAHASDHDIELCSQSGMNAYLCKPYKQQQLLDLVAKFTSHDTVESQQIIQTEINR